MKKFLSVFLAAVLAALIFAGCSNSGNTGSKTTPNPNANNNGNAEGIVKVGLGQNISIAKSKSAEGENGAVAQVDTVMAAVGLDKDGKVVSVTIDNAQTRVNFDKDGKITSDLNEELKTKVELGDKYGMKSQSGIGKEWYEQIAELEKWMIGKTIDEIKNLKTKKTDDNHPAVPDVPELTSVVTISVQDYIAAVAEAVDNAIAVENATKVGLGHNVSIAKSKSSEGDNGPVAQVDTVMAATAFTADNKVAGIIIDNAQTRVSFDKNGKITSDLNEELKTKVELGDKYGMKSQSGIGKEWYEQIAELSKWMKGKTMDEVTKMKNENTNSADIPELNSLVTISIQDYIKAIVESFDNAK
ncbi:MAG: hypothetical protein ACOX22_10960 [Caldicoprobacterales bacterium]|nr:hypothetical protein [Clostridiales bacterium]